MLCVFVVFILRFLSVWRDIGVVQLQLLVPTVSCPTTPADDDDDDAAQPPANWTYDRPIAH